MPILLIRCLLASKSPSPSYAVEGKNFTFEWNYTLNGTVLFANFSNSNESGSDQNIGKSIGPGAVTVQVQFKARFRAHVTNTRAQLTILAAQKSDEGACRLHLDFLPSGAGNISEQVIVVVNCK